MLKIWGRKNSVNLQKVLWCCGELGIPFDHEDIGGPFGGNDESWYLSMNPTGLVPTISEDGDITKSCGLEISEDTRCTFPRR